MDLLCCFTVLQLIKLMVNLSIYIFAHFVSDDPYCIL